MKRFFMSAITLLFIHAWSMAQIVAMDTIDTQKTIYPYSMPVKDIVVVNGGELRIRSVSEITIEGEFEVKVGGQLEIGKPSVMRIDFFYDNSGNRIVRKPEEVTQ